MIATRDPRTGNVQIEVDDIKWSLPSHAAIRLCMDHTRDLGFEVQSKINRRLTPDERNLLLDLEQEVLEERPPPPPPTVVVVVRDPDMANDAHVFGGEVTVVDMDLGAMNLDDSIEYAEWRESQLAKADRVETINAEAAAYIRSIVSDLDVR